MRERIPLQTTSTPGIFKRVGVRRTTYTVVISMGTDGRGNPIQSRKTFPTLAEAKDWQTKTLHERRAHAYVEPSKERLGAYLDTWLGDQRGRVKPVTILLYRQAFARWRSLHAIPLAALTSDHIQRTLREMAKADLASGTIAQSFRKLKMALGDAVKSRMIPTNPCDELRAPRERHRDPVSLNDEEVARFRAAIATDPSCVVFEVAIETGMRFSELAALRWEHVDVARGVIHVRENMTRTEDAKRIVGTPKSQGSVRDIAVSDDLLAMLHRHGEGIRARQRDEPGWNPHDLVFPSVSGRYMHAGTMNEALAWACERAGIKKLTMHGLRHSSGSLQSRAGLPIKVIAERMGHGHIATTMQYVHPDRSDHERAAHALAAVIRPKRDVA